MTEYGGSGDPQAQPRAAVANAHSARRAGRSQGSTSTRSLRRQWTLPTPTASATLSMRKVAERLGVGTMSLYTYVPGKAELLDLMFDQAVAGANEHVDGAWRERLERIAHENWWRYHRHPWLLEITMVRPVLGPNVIARYDHELSRARRHRADRRRDGRGRQPARRPRRGRGAPGARGGPCRAKHGPERRGVVGGARPITRRPPRTGALSRPR